MNSFTENDNTFHTCEFKNHLNILRQIYFFSRLPLETLKVFAYLCTQEVFRGGDYLFRQGDDDGQAFYLLCGTARLIREKNGEEYVIRDYGEDSFISATALMANVHRLYSLRALTDVTCLVMTRGKMSKALEQFPHLMPQVLRTLVERVYAWEEQFLIHHAENCETCMPQAGVSLI